MKVHGIKDDPDTFEAQVVTTGVTVDLPILTFSHIYQSFINKFIFTKFGNVTDYVGKVILDDTEHLLVKTKSYPDIIMSLPYAPLNANVLNVSFDEISDDLSLDILSVGTDLKIAAVSNECIDILREDTDIIITLMFFKYDRTTGNLTTQSKYVATNVHRLVFCLNMKIHVIFEMFKISTRNFTTKFDGKNSKKWKILPKYSYDVMRQF